MSNLTTVFEYGTLEETTSLLDKPSTFMEPMFHDPEGVDTKTTLERKNNPGKYGFPHRRHGIEQLDHSTPTHFGHRYDIEDKEINGLQSDRNIQIKMDKKTEYAFMAVSSEKITGDDEINVDELAEIDALANGTGLDLASATLGSIFGLGLIPAEKKQEVKSDLQSKTRDVEGGHNDSGLTGAGVRKEDYKKSSQMKPQNKEAVNPYEQLAK